MCCQPFILTSVSQEMSWDGHQFGPSVSLVCQFKDFVCEMTGQQKKTLQQHQEKVITHRKLLNVKS